MINSILDLEQEVEIIEIDKSKLHLYLQFNPNSNTAELVGILRYGLIEYWSFANSTKEFISKEQYSLCICSNWATTFFPLNGILSNLRNHSIERVTYLTYTLKAFGNYYLPANSEYYNPELPFEKSLENFTKDITIFANANKGTLYKFINIATNTATRVASVELVNLESYEIVKLDMTLPYMSTIAEILGCNVKREEDYISTWLIEKEINVEFVELDNIYLSYKDNK